MSSAKTKENIIEIICSALMERLTAKKIETKRAIISKGKFLEETKLGVGIKWRVLNHCLMR